MVKQWRNYGKTMHKDRSRPTGKYTLFAGFRSLIIDNYGIA